MSEDKQTPSGDDAQARLAQEEPGFSPGTEPEGDNGLPTIEFVGEEEVLGLMNLFNTFRIGLKWAALENVPGPINLHVTSPDEEPYVIRGASVLSVHQGTLGEMLDMHIGLNGGCTQSMPADRKIELRKILERVYGRRLTDDEKCVVLYLFVDRG